MYRLIYVLIGIILVWQYSYLPSALEAAINKSNGQLVDLLELSHIGASLVSLVGWLYLLKRVSSLLIDRFMLIAGGLMVLLELIFTTSWVLQYPMHKEMALNNHPSTHSVFEQIAPHTLLLNGYIGPKTYESLLSFSQKDIADRIIITSQGGDIGSAVSIALWISRNKVPVIVDGNCSSACVIIAVSGPHLYATNGSKFGFHQGAASSSINSQHTKYIGLVATEMIETELKIRGVPEDILYWVRNTPSDDMHYLTARQLKLAGVVDTIID